MIEKHEVHIVIPAFNEATRLAEVIGRARELGYERIAVVDDGSGDETRQVAASTGAVVLHHRVNLGAGAATQTGISYWVSKGARCIVTLDGDQQHLPEDIGKMVTALDEGGYDLVIGSRFLYRDNYIPFSRIVYNKLANVIARIITGMNVTDSQSGMKAMRGDFAGAFELNWDGFEFCIEQLRFARLLKAKVGEVPIRVIYDEETKRKGQNFVSGMKTLGNLIRKNS